MRGSHSNPWFSIYIFYANFFRNTKTVGFPRCKSRKDRQNFHCPQHCRVDFSNDKDTQGKRHTDLKLYHTLFVSRPLCDPCRFINSNSGVHYVDNSGHHYFLQEYENLFTLNPAHTFIICISYLFSKNKPSALHEWYRWCYENFAVCFANTARISLRLATLAYDIGPY